MSRERLSEMNVQLPLADQHGVLVHSSAHLPGQYRRALGPDIMDIVCGKPFRTTPGQRIGEADGE